MTFIDWFAGIGGFRRGMELAGHKCVGFCEYDRFAAASYTSMHLITDEQREKLAALDLKKRQKEILKEEYRNGEWYRTDIRQIRADDVPRADVWCFGAPCQSFSIAGKRDGMDGESGLVREIFRLLGELKEEHRPEYLIYENVKGMLSSNQGFDFAGILLEMGGLGYDVEWDTFNTKFFGIPQNRERVYTVGHLRARGERKIFPHKGTGGKDCVRVIQIGQRNRVNRNNLNQYRVYSDKGDSPTLNKMNGGGREPHIPVKMIGIDYNVGREKRDTANALTARYDSGVSNFRQTGTAVCIPVITPDRAEKRQNGRRFKDNGDDSFTLTAQDRHGVAVGFINAGKDGASRTIKAQYGKNSTANFTRNDGLDASGVGVVWYEKEQCYIAIRKLTPKECFRLQGWTDDYFEKAAFVNSDSQLYKQAGNGVTVAVAEYVGKLIAKGKNTDD